MRVRQLIERLEEALAWAGQEDAEVLMKTPMGEFISHLDVMADSAEMFGEDGDEKIVAVVGYTRFSSSKDRAQPSEG